MTMLSLSQAARQHPTRIALVLTDRELNYEELWCRVQPVVGKLEHSGLRRVGVVAGRDPNTLFVLYALLELGICPVLLHPRWGARERAAAIEDASTEYIVEAGELQPTGQPWPRQDRPTSPHQDPESEAAIVFTSGSSGRPRGAVLSRRALHAAADASAANLGWQSGDRWLLSMPLAHIGGFSILTRCLAGRRTVVLQPESRFDATSTVELVRSSQTTLWSLVPTMLTRLLLQEPKLTVPPSLRGVLLGGALASTSLVTAARNRGWPVLTTYGLTEACSQVATQKPGGPDTLSNSVGSPLPGVDVRVVDGEIQVRGRTLFSGYLSAEPQQGETTGVTRQQPTEWFPTGDEGLLLPDGSLSVIGRREHVIRTGGEQVHPAEVEHVLLLRDDITHACVFGLEDEEWGHRVCAAIVTRSSMPPAQGPLDEFLTTQLAHWKRPSRWVVLPQMSTLPNGKLDRKSVEKAARAQLNRN